VTTRRRGRQVAVRRSINNSARRLGSCVTPSWPVSLVGSTYYKCAEATGRVAWLQTGMVRFYALPWIASQEATVGLKQNRLSKPHRRVDIHFRPLALN
jgi:hypothetical protein